MTTTTKVKEADLAPIQFIKTLVEQPPADDVLAEMDTRVTSLKKELERIERETAADIAKTEAKYNPRIEQLEALVGTLDHPMERAARARAEEELTKLKDAKSKGLKEHSRALESARKRLSRCIETTAKTEKRRAILLPKYPHVPIDAIPWLKKGRGDPSARIQVVPIHVASASTQLTTRYTGFKESKTELVWKISIPPIEKVFKIRYMGEAAFDREHVFTFTGLLPPETKQAMKEAEADFTHMVMLADVKTLDVEVIEVDPDPLIMGWHEEAPDLLWLVAAFDMTPIEELIFDRALKPFHERKQKK